MPTRIFPLSTGNIVFISLSVCSGLKQHLNRNQKRIHLKVETLVYFSSPMLYTDDVLFRLHIAALDSPSLDALLRLTLSLPHGWLVADLRSPDKEGPLWVPSYSTGPLFYAPFS